MKDTFWSRLWCGTRKQSHSADWEALAGKDWADRVMDWDITDDFHAKQGRSTGRLILQAQGKTLSVYLKRHYRLPWWQRLLATLWPGRDWSPALQERAHLHWARDNGFLVPEPVAAAEYIGPHFGLQSVLAVKELTGMLPLHQAIPLAAKSLAPGVFLKWKRMLIREMARIARDLHRLRHYHKDFYLCHFYLARSDAEQWNPAAIPSFQGRLFLIDLHRLGHHALTWPLWQLKDLSQLLYSSENEGVTDRDRIYFWQLYRGALVRSLWIKMAEWCIRLKWRRYRGHNLKRKRLAEKTRTERRKEAA